MMLSKTHQERQARGQSHIPPHWVKDEATFFITVNCQLRGEAQLTVGEQPVRLLDTVSFYQRKGQWFPEIFMLMPDHIHALISFSWEKGSGINSVFSDWKRYTARQFGIEWQRDLFDHRIRSESNHQDKWAYIRENPVRKGLVKSYADWPHVWFPSRIELVGQAGTIFPAETGLVE